MNERLKFSWSHIIAFLALIAVSYVSFMGFTYLTNGDFTFALIGMGITDIVFIMFFIGAQQLKASGVRMKRKIVWERILICGSPVVFVAGMIAMSHFWTVYRQDDVIVKTFQNSINDSKQLFDDYEDYAYERLDTYKSDLTAIVDNKIYDPTTYVEAGFEGTKDSVQIINMVEILRLQLLSQNYDKLKSEAIEWIDKASNGASTWNIFLLGNTREIKQAINNWENQLKMYAAKQMSNEDALAPVRQFSSDGASDAIDGINSLTAAYTTQTAPPVAALIFGVVLYLMLLFPYFLQERHTKSTYRLFGTEGSRSKRKPKPTKKAKVVDEDTLGEADVPNYKENNDYPTF